MFKLLGVLGRASGLLITGAGAGVGVGVTQGDNIVKGAKNANNLLKLAAFGGVVYLITKKVK